MSKVNQGDVVRVHYTGRLEDGTEFDSSRNREPLQFVAGAANLISGVSQSVIGMSEGETKTVNAIQGDRQIPVWVRKLDAASAVIDANHPLAGKTLVFDLELVGVDAGR